MPCNGPWLEEVDCGVHGMQKSRNEETFRLPCVEGQYGEFLHRLNAEEIDRWFAELALARSARPRHELVENISNAVSRFMMIDKDILSQALLTSPCDWGENAPSDDLPTFYL